MFDQEFIKFLISLGVGGIIAGLIFAFYRKDIKLYTELWKQTTSMLMDTVKENTASNVKLIGLIENQERNSMRRSDIEALVQKLLQENKQSAN